MALCSIPLISSEIKLFSVPGGDTGINYARNGDNLPSPKQVIGFLSTKLNNKISLIRVQDANLEILEALSGRTNLVVTTGVPNEAIVYVSSSQEAADKWFQDHVFSYIGKGVRFRYLCVGNEAIPSVIASYILGAMINLNESIRKKGIDYIFVTTAVGSSVLGASYPPSEGQFAPGVAQVMSDITGFLYKNGSPLLINVYPFFALASEPSHISLDYALFQSQTPVMDGNLAYYNLFDAMVDAFVAAMVRAVGKEDVKVVVSETGWPTAGHEPYSSIENARTYNCKLREHVIGVGKTPRKPDLNMEVYIFEMFNEDLNAAGVGRNFGSFYPDFTEVYPLWH